MEETSSLKFSNKRLILIIIPVLLENILGITVGMVDTLMISTLGESAVSGVSLINSINFLLMSIFMTVATGGYVVISQFLGKADKENSCRTSEQLMCVITLLSVVVMFFTLAFNNQIIDLCFGKIEDGVRKSAISYFYVTALSYPFLAIFSAGCTLFRAMGKTNIVLYTSLLLNIINIIGNWFFVMYLGWDSSGVGMGTLISRIICTVVIIALAMNKKYDVHLANPIKWRIDFDIIKKILHISIPTAVDAIVFQGGKILIQGLIVILGTSAIAANAVAGNIAGYSNMTGNAIGTVLIMVVGRLVGAGDFDGIRYYTKKMMRWSIISMAIVNVFIFIFSNELIGMYNLTEEGFRMAYNVIAWNCIVSIFIWTESFVLPNTLRAANDARYAMLVSIGTMWTFRIGLSYILCYYFKLGLLSVWVAMSIDWLARGIFYRIRFKGDKWIEKAKTA